MQHPGDGPKSTDDLPEIGEERIFPTIDYDPQTLTCPGLIQPHGVLWVVDPQTLAIRAVSDNAPSLFHHSCEALLQQSLSDLLDPNAVDWIRQWVETDQRSRRSQILESQHLGVTIHRNEAGLICEFEPVKYIDSGLTTLDQLRHNLAQITTAEQVSSLLDNAVKQCCDLTGFERGLAYRFDSQGSGEVIAETKSEEAIAYLGLHFPSSDIPAQVRQIYQNGPMRYIPDMNASLHPLQTAPDFLSSNQIDLSHALLRSIDPCCLNYHRNMGVAALIVIPLIVDQQLWGLISLHHSQPRSLTLLTRELIEILGQSISLALTKTLKSETLAYEAHLKRLLSDLIHAFSESEQFEEVLVQPDLQILDFVQAQGAALCRNNGITLIGETPDGDAVLELLRWAQPQVSDSIYFTHQLPLEFEPAMAYRDKASGVLLLRISEQQNFSILWFRPERIEHIRWAGNPNQAVSVSATGDLGPRQSFEHWQELVEYTTHPWQESEIENALGLRAAISGIALRRADELARINQELEQSNEELASFAYAASHDLKEPLRGIYNYTTFLLEDYAELLDEAGIDRMQALLKLTKRMDQLIDALLKFAQMRQTDFVLRNVDLHRLVESVLEVIRISRHDIEFKVIYPRPLPTVSSDPVLLHELFSNLLSNALKYNDADHKIIEIGYLTPQEQLSNPPIPLLNRSSRTVFYMRDNGIGIRPRHQKSIFRLFKRLHARDRYGGGTGAGLTIVKKIVERHGGEVAVESTYGEGTTFWFSLT